jgi:hypothetical protein
LEGAFSPAEATLEQIAIFADIARTIQGLNRAAATIFPLQRSTDRRQAAIDRRIEWASLIDPPAGGICGVEGRLGAQSG